MNLDWHESLPPELQRVFDEVAQEAISLSDELNRKKEAQYIESLAEKLEVNYVTGAQLEAFREAVAPVYQHYIDRGEMTMNEVEQARKAARGT